MISFNPTNVLKTANVVKNSAEKERLLTVLPKKE
jgi:hypothetical protein